MDEFKTRFWNKTPKAYDIVESTGVIERVAPGRVVVLNSRSPFTRFAQWDEVIIEKSGVRLHERLGWVEPDLGPWVTVFLNDGDRELEQRIINGGHLLQLPKGIPVKAAIDLSDPNVYFSSVELKYVRRRSRSTMYRGYYDFVRELREIRTPRSDREIAALKAEMAKRNITPPEFVGDPQEEVPPYTCTIENKTAAVVHLHVDGGGPTYLLGPDRRLILESHSATTIYSRFDKISFTPKGVKCERNSNWENPYPFYIEVINEAGADLEEFTSAGRRWTAPKGIPIVAETLLNENTVFLSRREMKMVKTKVAEPNNPAYFNYVEAPGWIETRKPDAEIKRLQEMRERLEHQKADATAKKEIARKMPGFIKNILGKK